jgi:surface antigen
MNQLSPKAESALRSILLRALFGFALVFPCLALAAPPDWAPAHGWRKKNDAGYPGYSGRYWKSDYGVESGRCDRSEVGAVLGGFTGGMLGAEVASDADRAVAVVVGTVIGAAIGAEIGRRMDRTDRSCVGQSLELVADGKTVSWTNASTRVTYQMRPLRADGNEGCRKFRLTAHGAFGLSEGRTTACPTSSGVWDLAPEIRVSSR